MNKKIWKIDGYISAAHASRAAEIRGEDGLTGIGQECGPICLDYWQNCRGWVYRTRDGRFLVPRGEVPEAVMVEVYENQ